MSDPHVWLAKLTQGESIKGSSGLMSAADRLEITNMKERLAASNSRAAWRDKILDEVGEYENRLKALRDVKVKQGSKFKPSFMKKKKFLDRVDNLDAADVDKKYDAGAEQALIDECSGRVKNWKRQLKKAEYEWSVLDPGGTIVLQNPPPRLFDEKQIADVLYGPLVRRVLFPEGLVPEKYSEVAANMASATEAYTSNKALEGSYLEDVRKGTAVVGKLVASLASAAIPAAGVAKHGGGEVSGQDMQIVKLVAFATKAAVAGASLGVDALTFDRKTISGGIDKFSESLAQNLTRSLLVVDPTGGEFGKLFPYLVGTAVKTQGRVLARSLEMTTAKSGKEVALIALDGMIGTVADNIDLAGKGGETSEIKALMAAIASGVRNLASRNMIDTMIRALKTGDPGAWAELGVLFAGGITEAVTSGVKTHMIAEMRSGLDPESPEYKAAMEASLMDQWNNKEKMSAAMRKATDDLGKTVSNATHLLTFVEEQAMEEADMKSCEEAYEMELAGAGGSSKISAAMRRIRLQRAAIDLITGVMRLGGAAAGTFIPAARAAGTLGELIKVGSQLVEDIAAVIAFQESQQWAQNANSHYAVAMSSLLAGEVNLISRDTMKGLADFVKMAGELTQAGTHPAVIAAGKAVAAAGTVAEAGVDVASWAVDVGVAKVAWKITEKALRNPHDRRAQLKALKVNPTLAKYSLAYGAVVQQDPVARQIAGRCGGLNAQDLVVPEAQRKQVAEELYSLFQVQYDRLVVVKRMSDVKAKRAKTWADKIRLTEDIATWGKLVKAMTENGMTGINLKPAMDYVSPYRTLRKQVDADIAPVNDALLQPRPRFAPDERLDARIRTLEALRQKVADFTYTCDQLDLGLATCSQAILTAAKEASQQAKRASEEPGGKTKTMEGLKKRAEENRAAADQVIEEMELFKDVLVVERSLAGERTGLIDRHLRALRDEKFRREAAEHAAKKS